MDAAISVADLPQRPRRLFGWLTHLWSGVLFPGPRATDGPVDRVHLPSLLLLIVLPALLLYPSRQFALLEPDEGRYAQIPREMFARGEWVVPQLQGDPYLDKPPLLYWLVGITYALFGVSDATARIVPAVAVHLTILAVYLLGRRSVGSRAAAFAALLLSILPGFAEMGRLLIIDGLLTLWITLSLLAGYEAIRTGVFLRGWFVASAVCCGLGMLTKGPVSVLMLIPPLVLFLLLNRRRFPFGWKACAGFVAIVAAVNLPWYIAIAMHEPRFLRYFLWEHNILRFVKPFDHLQPFWFYIPIVLAGTVPLPLLVRPMIRWLRSPETTSGRSADVGFWFLAGGWCLLFFSVSGSKLPTYILPAFPSLMLGFGAFFASTEWGRARGTRLAGAAMVGSMLLANYVAIPWYANKRSPMRDPDTIARYCEPSATIICFPRQINSLAFYLGRDDLDNVRSKNAPEMVQGLLTRKKTVILFTHRHSFDALRYTLPAPLRISASESFADKHPGWIDRLIGETPWGLCHVAVIERD